MLFKEGIVTDDETRRVLNAENQMQMRCEEGKKSNQTEPKHLYSKSANSLT
jgi:hypothetical protein